MQLAGDGGAQCLDAAAGALQHGMDSRETGGRGAEIIPRHRRRVAGIARSGEFRNGSAPMPPRSRIARFSRFPDILLRLYCSQKRDEARSPRPRQKSGQLKGFGIPPAHGVAVIPDERDHDHGGARHHPAQCRARSAKAAVTQRNQAAHDQRERDQDGRPNRPHPRQRDQEQNVPGVSDAANESSVSRSRRTLMSQTPKAIANAANHWWKLRATASATEASISMVAASRPTSIARRRGFSGPAAASCLGRDQGKQIVRIAFRMKPLPDRVVDRAKINHDGGFDIAERDAEQKKCCNGAAHKNSLRAGDRVWGLGIFGPGVLGIAAAQFAPHLRIETLPESRQIGGGLHRAVVGRKQMDHQRDFAVGNARRFAHSEKILQARGDPGRLAGLVVDFGLAAAGQADACGRDFVQQFCSDTLFQCRDKRCAGGFQFGKALPARGKVRGRPPDVEFREWTRVRRRRRPGPEIVPILRDRRNARFRHPLRVRRAEPRLVRDRVRRCASPRSQDCRRAER